MGENKGFWGEVGDYFTRYDDNLRDAVGLRSEVKEQIKDIACDDGLEVDGIVDQVEELMGDEEIYERAKGKIDFLKSFKNWGELCKKANKEIIAIQCFAAGVILNVADGVVPIGRFVIGPELTKWGYENSEFLKKRVKDNGSIEEMCKVDYERVFSR